MKYPDQLDLLSFFESEPEMLDDLQTVPFVYNQATYRYSNNSNEDYLFIICPSYNEVKIQVFDKETKELISYLEFNDVESLDILSDKKLESRMMVSTKSSVVKINFKPRFKLFLNEPHEIDF